MKIHGIAPNAATIRPASTRTPSSTPTKGTSNEKKRKRDMSNNEGPSTADDDETFEDFKGEHTAPPEDGTMPIKDEDDLQRMNSFDQGARIYDEGFRGYKCEMETAGENSQDDVAENESYGLQFAQGPASDFPHALGQDYGSDWSEGQWGSLHPVDTNPLFNHDVMNDDFEREVKPSRAMEDAANLQTQQHHYVVIDDEI